MADEALGTDAQAARTALDRSSRAAAAGRQASHRSLWLHCLATALGSTACLLAIGAVDHWGKGVWLRALLNGLLVGALAGLVVWTLQRQRVRAAVTRRQKSALALGGILAFAVPAGAGPASVPAYAVGAAGIFAFWLCAAWWLTRDR
jgi:hypothetical protein